MMKSYYWFVKEQWAVLAFGFLAVFWGNFGQTYFVGLFSAPIQQSLNLSAGVYGSAYSIATLGSAVTVIWAGSLIDRYPLQIYTAVICIGLAVSALVLSQSYNVVFLILGFFLLRLFGQALLPHTGSTTMARAFEAHRGKALSIAASGFPVGEVVLPFTAVMLIAVIGWRGTYLAIAIWVAIIVLPFMQYLIRYAKLDLSQQEEAQQEHGKHENTRQQSGVRTALLTDYRYWLALPGLMAGPFIATGIFIHQDFVVQSKGWTPTWFATCFVVYGVVHWLSSLVSGVLVDRFTAVKLLPFFLLPMGLSLIFLAVFSGPWLALVFMSLMAATIGSSPPISGALWPEIYGVHNLGTVRSLNIAIMVFATALSPALYGFCIDNAVGLEWIFGLSAVYVFLASVLMGFSYFRYPDKHPIAK